jgi:phosphoribosylformimino-5-aminoimidazole carboxamide ribotide isomerase
MELIPAIDLLGGKVVRLTRGRYDQVTVYSERPVEQARLFYDAGARRLHIVDLDGARDGQPKNLAVIEAILRAVPMAIQVGGGIRDEAIAKRWFNAGAERVVLGTAAVKQPELVQKLCVAHPTGVVVAVDERDGEVAIEGWLEGSGMQVLELATRVDGWGAAALLHTVIARDGTREGPDVDATCALQARVRATVIASGGIGELEHIRTLAERGVRAAVCGRALLSGAFTVEAAFAAAGMSK